ncbi:hypothetical protein PanWU01x14_055510, partial [Parasponia andersonii]
LRIGDTVPPIASIEVSHLKADVITDVRHAMTKTIDIFQAKTVEDFCHHGDIDSGEDEDETKDESDDGG